MYQHLVWLWFIIDFLPILTKPNAGLYARHSKSNVRKSNSIELNRTQSVDWVRQSNEIEHHTFSEFDFRTNRIQSNKSSSIELNPSDCVRLSSETELNRTQLNGFRSIGSGEPIQSKPKASPSKQVFLALFFTIYSITKTPFINCPRQLREQNRTKQSYHYSRGRISKLSYPFLFLANLQ